MLYLIKSYLPKGKFIYKVGYSDKSNIDTRLNSYFYHSPGNEVIALRQGDELLEKLIHFYLYFRGYRYQKNGQLNEWFIGDSEVISIFHISRESLEKKLWKHRNEVFNKDKFRSTLVTKSLDFNLFKYLYNKNKDTFVGERFMLTEDKQVIKLNPKPIDIAFYRAQIKYFPDEVVTKSLESLTENVSEYKSYLEKEIDDFLLYQFNTTGIFRTKMKMYCDFLDCYHEYSNEISDIIYYRTKDSRFRTYYNFFGSKGCKALRYQENYLKQTMISASKEYNLSLRLYILDFL